MTIGRRDLMLGGIGAGLAAAAGPRAAAAREEPEMPAALQHLWHRARWWHRSDRKPPGGSRQGRAIGHALLSAARRLHDRKARAEIRHRDPGRAGQIRASLQWRRRADLDRRCGGHPPDRAHARRRSKADRRRRAAHRRRRQRPQFVGLPHRRQRCRTASCCAKSRAASPTARSATSAAAASSARTRRGSKSAITTCATAATTASSSGAPQSARTAPSSPPTASSASPQRAAAAGKTAMGSMCFAQAR